ncbi:MAG: Hsp33 family molecular chaperone HslO [Leptospiraceae bacterium]|nr:Hsp33 family molecular chaperone HslO [Leptospiraceae bacterium]MDW8306346.1 Hsp33 family molecular chaperone HslO [Leptospiraceae bacterium]
MSKLQHDFLKRYISLQCRVRAVLVLATQAIETARQRHGLNPIATLILGELMLAALIKASAHKADERIQLRIETEGPLKAAIAEATATGEVRGYVANPQLSVTSTEKKDMLREALRGGFLQVKTLRPGYGQSSFSSVEMKHLNVAQDFTYYFVQSEQIPTAIQLSVGFLDDFTVNSAMGIMFQALPGAKEEDLVLLESGLIDHPSFARSLQEGLSPEELFRQITSTLPFEEISQTPVCFLCHCSHRRFYELLSLLPLKELTELAQEGQTLVCHYCAAKYYYSRSEIEKIIEERSGYTKN